MDFACKLKVATDDDRLRKLQREMEHLDMIRRRDPQLAESPKYIVGWLLPSQLLNQDSIFFLDGSGDRISTISPLMLQGLVLECGGMDLQVFLKNETLVSVPITQRIQILEQVVEAVRFVHKVGLIHFDLKPENIVCFTSGHRLRWKLIDFDSCHDEKCVPAPVVSRDTFASAALCLTEDYAPPEVMRVILCDEPDAAAELPINWRFDIWSLGLVSFYLLTNGSFWTACSSSFSSSYRSAPLSSMVAGLRQADVDSILSKLKVLDTKERSFLKGCLRIDPSERLSASALLEKTLFSTKTATLEAHSLRASTEEMQSFLKHFYETRYPAASSALCSVEDLDSRLDELCAYLVPKLEQILSMNHEDMHRLLKSSLQQQSSAPPLPPSPSKK
jgi:serine/threonine protein kinase